jgi:hypothetical protein
MEKSLNGKISTAWFGPALTLIASFLTFLVNE